MPTETGTAFDNGITVHHKGQTRHLELDGAAARDFFWYAGIASPEDSIGDSKYPLTEEQMTQRIRRSSTIEKQADDFKTHLAMIANLDVRQLARVVSLLDLMQYGNSWMLETIEQLLDEVLCSGPAKANEIDPRIALARVAYHIYSWWDDIDTARSQMAQHPELFPREATPEPPAAEPIQPATAQPTKAQGARKPRKKSHAKAAA